MLLINCSNREATCFKVLNDIKTDNDKILSLSKKDMKFCDGCEKCRADIEKHCVLDDYITNNVYEEIIKEKDIVFACPIYMSNINAIFKNLIDRLNPFYHHRLLEGKRFYLILTGIATKEDNDEEIKGIIDYFNGISQWLYIYFEFLDYFEDINNLDSGIDYNKKIEVIKEKLKNQN